MTDADEAPDDSPAELEDDGVLDAADSLEGNPGDDPLDQGIVAPDRWSAGQRYGTTASEERAGESLDQLLAEEEPDLDPYAGDEPLPSEGVGEEWADEEADLVAGDVGIDAGAASAEEAAMHVVDDDDRDIRSDG